MTELSEFRKRKQARKEYFLKYVHGWKEIPCIACNGSGYYDSFNSPKCGGCDGTGKEKVSPKEYQEWVEYRKENSHVCKWGDVKNFKKENCGFCNKGTV